MEHSTVLSSSLISVSSPSMKVKPKFIYGLNTGVNVLFLNDSTIIYPASGVMVMHDIVLNTQRFLRLPPRRTVTAIDLTAINNALAVATAPEREKDESTIIIYDLKAFEGTKHVFFEPAEEWRKPGRRRFADMRFLYNNVSIAALAVGGDGSDCVLYFYSWRTSKIETYVRVDGMVADVALNPINTAICCFVGKNLFQLMTKLETDWSQYGFREAEGIHFTCVKWLCGDRCLAGTIDGRVILFKSGVMQAAYLIESISELDVMVKAKTEDLSIIKSDYPRSNAVRKFEVFQFGFVVLVGDSTIYYFQIMDNGQRYVRNNVYEKYEYWYLESPKELGESPMHHVESMCISPGGRKIMCVTKKAQLHWALLHRREDPDADDELFNTVIEIEPLGEELHHGGVESLSACLWKPLLMTCGKLDCTVKLWNYFTYAMLLSVNYQKLVFSVSLHPTGLFCVVAFSDHVEYLVVEFDDLVLMKTFQIKDSHLVSFSNSGNMFAVARPNNQLDVYSSHTFETCFSCLGHLGTIETLIWCYRDTGIIVRGSAGFSYMIDPRNGEELRKIKPYKGVKYTDLAVTDDVERIYGISEDGTLKEIYQQKIIRVVNLNKGPLNAICISKSNSILFVATKNGLILSLLLPLLVEIAYETHVMHNSSITKMRLTMDNTVLVSCSEDGSMCMWEVEEVTKLKMIDTQFHYCDDILVTRPIISKMNKEIIEIDKALIRLKEENEQFIKDYKLDKEKKLDKVKRLNAVKLSAVRRNIQNMVEMQKNNTFAIENSIRETIASNKQVIGILRTVYSDTLLKKYHARIKLKGVASAAAAKLKEELDILGERHKVALQELRSDYEKIFQEKLIEVEQLKEMLIKEYTFKRSMLVNAQKNVEKEVSDTKKKFDDKLSGLKNLNATINYKIDHSKTKYRRCKFDTEVQNNSNKELLATIEEIKSIMMVKSLRVYDIMRLMKQSDGVVKKKDEEVKEAKQALSKLEKTRNALKKAISILVDTTDPLNIKIQEMINKIDELDAVYIIELLEVEYLEANINQLTDIWTQKEFEKSQNSELMQAAISDIKVMEADMFATVQFHKNKDDNRAIVMEFFDKYVVKPMLENSEELATREEYFRQNDYLKCCISKLEKELKTTVVKNETYYLLMEENMLLMKQMNDVRKKIKKYLGMYNLLKHELKPDADSGESRPTEQTELEETTYEIEMKHLNENKM